MDAAEKQLVLEGFNLHNQVTYTTRLVHGMFADHVKTHPGSPCVVFENYVFTYAEVGRCEGCEADSSGPPEQDCTAQPHHYMHVAVKAVTTTFPLLQVDAAANRIAHYLRNQAGVVPGDIVAVLCLRSPLMIAALLGVFKAGAGYLPLDHHHPEARIDFMLEDAGVKVSTAHGFGHASCMQGCMQLW